MSRAMAHLAVLQMYLQRLCHHLKKTINQTMLDKWTFPVSSFTNGLALDLWR